MADAGGAQCLPVGFFGHELGALGLDHVDGVGDVLAQLRIAQDGQRGLGKWQALARVEHRMVGAGWLMRRLRRTTPQWLARIWAR